MGGILVTAFLEGLSVLVIEIAGARALSPFFGTSLRVWTAQITATLLFLALGYGLGAWLCRRRPMALAAVFWCAGGWLALYPLWRGPVLGALLPLGVSSGAFAASAWLFGPPLMCLGAVSPLLIQRLGRAGVEGGTAAGWLFFTNTLGGLAGGWLTALVFVPHAPLRLVIAGTGVLVALLGAYWARPHVSAAAALGAPCLAMLLMGGAPGPERTLSSQEPDAPRIVVREHVQSATGLVQVVELPGVFRSLLINGVAQGAMDLVSGASYEQFSDYLTAVAHRYHASPRSALVLGLGCGSLAKSLAAMKVAVTAVEIEPRVVDAARRHFDLPATVRVVEEDGRAFLARDGGRYDLILLDAFAGENAPWYLLTREGLAALKARLAPGGRVLVNTISRADGESEGLKRLEAGLLAVFGEALVFVEPRLPNEAAELVNATLVAGQGLSAHDAPYPLTPSQRVAPYLGDLEALPPRPARAHGNVDTDELSSLDVVEADLRMKWRASVLETLSPSVLND
jgi:spermidine synthase